MSNAIKLLTSVMSFAGMWMVLGTGIAQAGVDQYAVPLAKQDRSILSRPIKPRRAKPKASSRITMRRGARVGYVQELIVDCPMNGDAQPFTTLLRYSIIEKTVCNAAKRCFSGVRAAAVNTCRANRAQSSAVQPR